MPRSQRGKNLKRHQAIGVKILNSDFLVATVQMTSVDQIENNLLQIENIVQQIFASASPQLVCFPENCLYLRVVEGEKIEGMDITHPAFIRLAKLAEKNNTHLHLGSVPLQMPGGLYNSSILIKPTGEILPTYQKIHLFDIQLENQAPIRESDVFCHGASTHIIEIDGWRIGQTICYDLRFAELFSIYARKEVDLILVPAAFLVKTGEAHWHILLRARAIESQAYVVASAQGGTHIGKEQKTRETYGHSLVVDPWGLILDEIEAPRMGYTITKLTRDRLKQVRKQIPMSSHRRIHHS